MNDWQLVGRLKRILSSRRWGGDPANGLVFPYGSVMVSAMPLFSTYKTLRMPSLILRPGPSRADREFPHLKSAQFIGTLLVAVPGDYISERVFLGGNRSDRDSSDGASLMQLNNEVQEAVADLLGRDGVNLISVADSEAAVAHVEEVGYVAYRELRWSADITTAVTDEAPRALAAADLGGGSVRLTWEAPADTTGLIEYTLVRVAGNVPAAFPDEGTPLTVSSAVVTVDDNPGAGTYSYSLFARYDGKDRGVKLSYSDCDVVRGVVLA